MRGTLLMMVPVNLLLVVWIWIGRLVFGVGGWLLLIMLPVAVVVLVGLTVTTVLAFAQPGRPRSLTRAQTLAQLSTWVGMLGFGGFLPDYGSTEDSYTSVLSVVFERSDYLNTLSFAIAGMFGTVAVIAYIVLLVLLVSSRRATPAPAPS